MGRRGMHQGCHYATPGFKWQMVYLKIIPKVPSLKVTQRFLNLHFIRAAARIEIQV